MNTKTLRSGSARPSPVKPGKIRLYQQRFCPFCERVRLVLDHKGIDYEIININLGDKPEWYLELNPSGAVPLLEHDGKILTDSAIVAEYIDGIFPEEKLIQSDPFLKAKQQIQIGQFGKVTAPFGKLLHGSTDEVYMTELYAALGNLQDKLELDYFSGNDVGFADLILWPWFERFDAVLELVSAPKTVAKDFPKLQAFVARMEKTKGVKKAKLSKELHQGHIKSVHAGKSDYDFGL